MAKTVQTYSDYPGYGWHKFGRLIINFSRNRATSIFFNGELFWLSDPAHPGGGSM